MTDVRMVFKSEADSTIQKDLLAILDDEDGPPHTIYGRGVIPGRVP